MELVGESLGKISDHFCVKALLGVFFLVLFHHMLLFSAFTVLVFADVLTKCLAVAASVAKKSGNAATLWEAAAALPEARREGLISARAMRRLGASKLLVYNLMVLTSGTCDWMLLQSGNPSGVTGLVISYLAMTELFSVIGHLGEAGVPGMRELKKRLERGK